MVFTYPQTNYVPSIKKVDIKSLVTLNVEMTLFNVKTISPSPSTKKRKFYPNMYFYTTVYKMKIGYYNLFF